MAKKNKKYTKLGARTYKEFLILFDVCTDEQQAELMSKLDKARKPYEILGKDVPENLNMLTYGQLDDLSRIGPKDDPLGYALKVVMGIAPEKVYDLNVFDVFGFANFLREEVQRINKLFSSIKVKHSSDEVAAGVEQLDFGTFGVIDWYARRMGITNQDEVYSVAWVRIYTCMKNDAAQNEYERRLHEQVMKKNKIKQPRKR